MNVAVGGTGAPVSEQASRDMQALAVHDRVRGVCMTQIVKPRIRHDSGRVVRLGPEPVGFILGQRSFPPVAGEYPIPGSRIGETVQQLPRRIAEQDVPRPALRVARRGLVRPDLASVQAAYLARPALGQQDEPHRRDPDRASAFELPQNRAGQPPAWRTPVACDAGTWIPCGFAPVTPHNVVVEHVAQYLMTAKAKPVVVSRSPRQVPHNCGAGRLESFPSKLVRRNSSAILVSQLCEVQRENPS